ncbi:MAG: hypothetical protein ACRD13_08935 [Terriglobales bacterium]
MAFCNKCGATLDANVGFCGQCGSRNAATAGLSPLTAAVTPARRGMSTGAKIGIGIAAAIGAIVVVLVVFGLYVAAHIKKVQLADGQTRVETPFGNAVTGQPSDITAHRLGIPVYPGASPEGSVVGSLGSMQGALLRFHTPDAPGKVLAFYQRHLAGSVITNSISSHAPQLTASANGYKLTVAAQSQNGETEIVIVRGKQ